MLTTGENNLLDSPGVPDYHIDPVYIGPTWKRGDDGRFVLPERTLGWQILRWIHKYVGAGAGKPFTPTKEQARLILWWYAIDERGRFIYRDGVIQRIKGWGKDPIVAVISLVEMLGPCRFSHWAEEPDHEWDLDVGDPVGEENDAAWIQVVAVSEAQPLALSTPVRTAVGWKTMGELQIGDEVFGSTGTPVPIVRDTEVMTDLDCYEVSFSDGEKIVASASHGWTVENLNGHGDGYVRQTLSTAELAATWDARRTRYRIPIVPALTDDRDDLELDPYMLGLWLGDGSTTDSTVAIDWRIRDEVSRIIEPYIEPHEEAVWTYTGGVNSGTFRIRTRRFICPRGHDYTNNFYIQKGNRACRACVLLGRAGRAKIPRIPTFREKLRSTGVLGTKHVPQKYLLAGTSQRLALLQGLMDSDGSINKRGRASFTNKNPELINAIRDILSSLGMRHNTQPASNGAQVVLFTPTQVMNPFRLGYKAERVHSVARYTHRHITGVRRVDSVPVRCIGIDAEDHLFQVGRTGILTHNTKNTMKLFPRMITRQLMQAHGMTKLDIGKTFVSAYGGSRGIEAVTSNPATLEGNRPTFVIRNESHHWTESTGGHELAEVIERNATKSAGGMARALSITNAYDPSENSVAQVQREAWEAENSGEAPSTGMFYDSIEAPEDVTMLPPEAKENWKQASKDDAEKAYREACVRAWLATVIAAVRGDAVWLDIETIVNSILRRTVRAHVARRFWFNAILAGEDAWADPAAVTAAIEPLLRTARTNEREGDQLRLGWVVDPTDPIVMFFDGSKSDDATGLVGVRVSDGYTFVIGIWSKPAGEAGKDWLSPRFEVDARVDEAFARFNVVAFWADPSHTLDDDSTRYWDGIIDGWHRKYKERLQASAWSIKSGPGMSAIMWDMANKQRSAEFTAAAERVRTELHHRDHEGNYAPLFSIDGHPALQAHLRNARENRQPEGVSIRKKNRESRKKIDLAACLIGGQLLRRVLLNQGVEEKETTGGWVVAL